MLEKCDMEALAGPEYPGISSENTRRFPKERPMFMCTAHWISVQKKVDGWLQKIMKERTFARSQDAPVRAHFQNEQEKLAHGSTEETYTHYVQLYNTKKDNEKRNALNDLIFYILCTLIVEENINDPIEIRKRTKQILYSIGIEDDVRASIEEELQNAISDIVNIQS